MLTCRGASHLVSESQDRPLGGFENGRLRIHLWMCINCRRFERQIGLMRRLLRQSGPDAEAGATRPLSTEAHERISKAIAGQ